MTSKKKLLFIYNPNAGKGRIRSYLSQIIERLCNAGYDISIYATQGPREATDLVKEKGNEYDVIVCSGGDGTINEVVSGVLSLEKKPKIGYFPTGTVNDFASSLEISSMPLEAVETIIGGNTYRCDIGLFNGRCFNYVAAFGAFTEVSYETPQKNKNAIGKMAYFVDAMRLLPEIRGYNMKLISDGVEISGEYVFGMISNSKSVGGVRLEDRKHKIDMDDGLFEVVMIKNPKNPRELEQTLQCMLTRNFNDQYIEVFRSSELVIEFDEPVKWTLDGESGGANKRVEIKCISGAVDIFAEVYNS